MSDAVEPTVVDSPIAMPTAESPGTSPIESLLVPRKPADISEIEQRPAAEVIAPVVAETADTSADEIKQLGDMIGVDLSRFKDPESARIAAEMHLERLAAAGETPALFGTPQEEPAAVVEKTDDLGLDESTVDPALLKVLKGLKGENAELKKQFAQKEQTQKAEQWNSFVKQTETKAEAHLDKLENPVFGKAGSRTLAQKFAYDNVMGVTGKLLKGLIVDAQRTGRTSLPPIETVVDFALRQVGVDPKSKPAAAVVITKGHTLAPKTAAGGVGSGAAKAIRVSSGNDPYNLFGKDADPHIRAIWQDAMSGS